MKTSMVLKDEKNRPQGYVMALRDEIVCRVQADQPMEAVLLFDDGSKETIQLAGGIEQRVRYPGKAMTGCCVLCEERIMLASDEKARAMCCLMLSSQKNRQQKAAAVQNDNALNKTEVSEDIKSDDEEVRKEEHTFAQLRWPPPPCWESACYRMGQWQEIK